MSLLDRHAQPERAVMFERLKAESISALDGHDGEDFTTLTLSPGLTLVRTTQGTLPTQVLYKPVLAIAIQGTKQVSVGDNTFRYSDGQALVVGLDVPAYANVLGATPATPYLGLTLELDFGPMREAAEMLGTAPVPDSPNEGGIFVFDCSQQVIECLTRLVTLPKSPQAIAAIQPLIIRELCFWMLSGPQGEDVRRLVLAKGSVRRVLDAVRLLRERYQQPLRVEDLAAHAAMSPSSFYQHFRALTSMTPLQYQKQMRLLEARSLLAETTDNIAQIAFSVGYGSVSQFHREYKRAFGGSPRTNLIASP
jgi:AraC-like DNA-binding protein